jgi:hypothetical protein
VLADALRPRGRSTFSVTRIELPDHEVEALEIDDE